MGGDGVNNGAYGESQGLLGGRGQRRGNRRSSGVVEDGAGIERNIVSKLNLQYEAGGTHEYASVSARLSLRTMEPRCGDAKGDEEDGRLDCLERWRLAGPSFSEWQDVSSRRISEYKNKLKWNLGKGRAIDERDLIV
jgi:hypothetical protein